MDIKRKETKEKSLGKEIKKYWIGNIFLGGSFSEKDKDLKV